MREGVNLQELNEAYILNPFIGLNWTNDAGEQNIGDGNDFIDENFFSEFGEIQAEFDNGQEIESIAEETADAVDEIVDHEEIQDTDDNEPLSFYLKEIARNELLTPEEERQYSRTIWNGFKTIIEVIRKTDHPKLGKLKAMIDLLERRDTILIPQKQFLNFMLKEVAGLCKKYPELCELESDTKNMAKKIETAKDKMIKGNLRFVVYIAKRYRHRGLSLADLIQEGNIGLMRAVFRYDSTKGNRFGAYARWWIKQTITRAIGDTARTIRVPVHLLELRSRFYNLFKELGREPTIEDMVEKTGISMKKVLALLAAFREPISLETPIGNDETPLSAFIKDWKTPDPIESVNYGKLREKVKAVLVTLSPYEEKIIRLRFGIGEDREYTLLEIGKQFNVTREWIRQIEQKAFKRLKCANRKDKLKGFLD